MKTIPLNIMTSYPVKWTKQQVLRDIIQNFYDDIGLRDFGKKFKKEYIAEQMSLSAVSSGFSYEWLLHVGASTKQEQSGQYAGFYGEGFKMAVLCALRDYGWQINMRSRDWSIEVCVLATNIDGKKLRQLAYNVEEGLEHSPETVLTINPFSQDDVTLLNDVVLGFYYPENPLIGKLIFENEYAAVHERSKIPKPKHFAISFDVNGDGLIFTGFQARGSFVKPLVICNHRFKTEDRERNHIYFTTVLSLMIDLVDLIDAKTSCYLLEQLEKYWYDYPETKDDVKSWYSLIRKLIRKIVYQNFTSMSANDFIKNHPDLAVCERPTNTHMRNRKAQALMWRKLHLPESRLVQDSFCLLGYKTIVDLCEKSGGYNVTRMPNNDEKQLLNILEHAAKSVLDSFITNFPECLVIENDSSVWSGTANLLKNKKVDYNNHGLRILYTINYIEIKKSLLTKDSFMKAISTYFHELCHCFGGDSSASFSLALTRVIELTIENAKKLQEFEHKWIAICSARKS